MKKTLRGAVLVAVLGIMVFLGWKLTKPKPEGASDTIQAAVKQETVEAAVPVKVIPLPRGDLPLRLTISADTEVRERAAIKAEVEGTVERLLRREGDQVAQGDLVVKLASRERELALRQAEAARLEAYSRFVSQYQTLKGEEAQAAPSGPAAEWKQKYLQDLGRFKSGAISRAELQKTEEQLLGKLIDSGALQGEVKRVVAALTSTELELEGARIGLEKTWIRAPFAGTIAAVSISTGERLAAGQEVFRIVNLDSLYLKGQVLETEFGKVKAGQRARIRFLASPQRPVYGRVEAVSPELDREKNTGTVFIGLDRPGHIPAGIHAEVEVEYEVCRQVLKVPREALIVRSGRPLIFIVRDGIALWQYVETGAMNGEEIEVRSEELNAGDQVVVEGQLTLAHQARVKIVQ